ncbi:MAG: hypothetical protein K2H75_00445 [Muribaculaceae bacterium]|nr:hypothetical protein [Muribaculaceae bacterium]
MRRLISTGLLVTGLLMPVKGFAKAPTRYDSVNGESIVLEMMKSLPIETPTSGTLISIVPPAAPLSITTDMGNIPVQNMQAFANEPEVFKNAIMENFSAMGKDIVCLARAAYDAGIPLSIHLVSLSFPEGFVITFSVEELGKGLAQKEKI